jgi:UDP-GlcNAc:undecaprenyl-phosphate GlcNAc-1-phosphate transferase
LAVYLAFSAVIVSTLALSSQKGNPLISRTGFLDVAVKGRLRKLREEGSVIRITFRVFESGIPLLFLSVCLLPQKVPGYAPWISLACAALLGAAWLAKRGALDTVLRGVIYLSVPAMVYLSVEHPPQWLDGTPGHLYTALFGLFAVCILVISKFSRRIEGFKSTPMDFLILFLVVMLIKGPAEQFQEEHVGLIAAKVLILYFSYEVLIAEQRSNLGRITAYTVATCLIFALKSFLL